MKVYTIGYKGKGGAESFFERIKANHIDLVIDVREKNTSQLVGFSKYPDIKFFIERICGCIYIHDPGLSIYIGSLKNEVTRQSIRKKYSGFASKMICVMSAEEKSKGDPREVIAQEFVEIFGGSMENI